MTKDEILFAIQEVVAHAGGEWPDTAGEPEVLRRVKMLARMAASHGQAPAGATLPDGWVPLTITHEGQYPEEVAYGPQIMMDRLGKWLGKYFAQAAQADRVLEDAARWEFRWLNPANNLHVAPSDLGWKTVNSKGMRSEKEVLEDLQAYRYQGKPVYEVRPLLATRALEKPEIRCPVRLANGGDCPRHNLQCGWPDCNKESK